MHKTLNGTRILVVDDSDDLRETLAFVLSKAGAEVDTAADGMQAISKAQAATYQMIILDVRMPGLDGHATAERISAASCENEKPIFIALSGEQRGGGEFPFALWLHKPIKPQTLLQSIIAALPGAG